MTYKLVTSLTNETEGYVFSEWDEPLEEGWTLTDEGAPDFGQLFRLCRREYGRCTSSVYVDREDGPSRRVGWYFEKRNAYEGGGGTYLQGAWVSVVEVVAPAQPEQRRFVSVA